MLIFRVKIVCRVAYFSFLTGIRRVALSSFAYCQNRFYPILIDVFPANARDSS